MGSIVVMKSSTSAMKRILYSAGLLVVWWAGAALMIAYTSGTEIPQTEPIEPAETTVQITEAPWIQQTTPALLSAKRSEAVAALESVLPETMTYTAWTPGKRISRHRRTASVGPACYSKAGMVRSSIPAGQ